MWAERVAGSGEKLWELDKEAFYLDIKERTCPSKDTQVGRVGGMGFEQGGILFG